MSLLTYIEERGKDKLYENFEVSHVIIKDRINSNDEFKLSIESDKIYQKVTDGVEKLDESDKANIVKSSQFFVTFYSEKDDKIKTIACESKEEIKQIVKKTSSVKTQQFLKESADFMVFSEGIKSIRNYDKLKSCELDFINESATHSTIKIDGIFYIS